MANEDHLDILKQGVSAWNAWRQKHFLDVVIDLSGPDLSGANLRGVDLRGVDLSETNLTRVNLSEADLIGAYFFETILVSTDLRATKRLDRCTHGGPSAIDHRTLVKSGSLPLAFLQG